MEFPCSHSTSQARISHKSIIVRLGCHETSAHDLSDVAITGSARIMQLVHTLTEDITSWQLTKKTLSSYKRKTMANQSGSWMKLNSNAPLSDIHVGIIVPYDYHMFQSLKVHPRP